ncbi:hypothetical protein NDU88_003228 [Pleurodeles waltl]|uniref:Uncharacterized protein n=1 Tax=Pleurodeles waltl TaxID=8319 RepID=A0AAV7NJA2_PLEWA|nr:hypothetical protein NDU88_003228 [Pleurodeles waltl]
MVANRQRFPASKEELGGCRAGTRTVKKTAEDGVAGGGLNGSSAGGWNSEGRRNPEGERSNIVAETSASQEV